MMKNMQIKVTKDGIELISGMKEKQAKTKRKSSRAMSMNAEQKERLKDYGWSESEIKRMMNTKKKKVNSDGGAVYL